jgi:hypothetical protein
MAEDLSILFDFDGVQYGYFHPELPRDLRINFYDEYRRYTRSNSIRVYS